MPFDPKLSLEEASTIPSSWYLDPAVLEKERYRVFGDTWQFVGRTDQVSAPGSYFTADIAGNPIVVVNDDGVLRAFHNVCRHKGTRLVRNVGCITKFRCPYHGWTYDLEGKLRGTPEFDGARQFCKEDNGLQSMPLETFGPLIFVNYGCNPPSLKDFLDPLDQIVLPTNLSFYMRREYTLNCNWKVFVDNYLDGGYHVNYVHPGLADALDYKQYHVNLYKNWNVQVSPTKEGVSEQRAGTAYYTWVFPNLMLNVYDGVMDTNHVYPLGADKCKVLMDFYFDEKKSQDNNYCWKSIEIAKEVQEEDVFICEEVQIGLNSSSYNTGRFCPKREAGGYHFHRLLAERVG